MSVYDYTAAIRRSGALRSQAPALVDAVEQVFELILRPYIYIGIDTSSMPDRTLRLYYRRNGERVLPCEKLPDS